MKNLSKEEKLLARIALCGGLDDAYKHYRALNDLHALDVIAFCYCQSGMPDRAQQIRVEISQLGGVNVLTADRKCVPSGGIISPDVQCVQSLAGGTHENPVENPIRLPVDPVCVGTDGLHTG